MNFLLKRSFAKLSRPPELAREFIRDCLYNPDYGYFCQHANIFTTSDIPFTKLRDQEDYVQLLHRLYKQRDLEYAQMVKGLLQHRAYHQQWHTPSELFKPWYGHAIARYLLKEHQQRQPLVIYELGPGNGTLCQSILDFIHKEHPEQAVEYHLIEISERMHRIQKRKLFDWNTVPNISIRLHHGAIEEEDGALALSDQRPCFVLAMEVLDNLPHDLIRFEAPDGHLREAIVESRADALYGEVPGKMHLAFRPAQDQLILDLVSAMEGRRSNLPINRIFPSLAWSPVAALGETFLPGWQSPWRSEWIPTGAYRLFGALHRRLPQHRLVTSDFTGHRLPDAIPGWRGPIVQTRYGGLTVACQTFLLQRGLFDIFFPVDPHLMAHLWMVNRPSDDLIVVSHGDFVRLYGDTSRTQTQSGYNPMTDDFENVSMLLT